MGFGRSLGSIAAARLRALCAAGLTLAVCAAGIPAGAAWAAQDQASGAVGIYPDRPVRFLVGFPPGGPNDQLARLLGARLSERLRQPVVIENKSGSNGELAAAQEAQAAPDGYTLLFGSSGALAVSPSLSEQLPYDPIRDLVPVSSVAMNPMILVVSPKSGITGMTDLIARARAHPGKLTFASAGTGSPTHLAGELLKSEAGIDLLHVPYRGGGQAMNGVMSGEIDMYFSGVSTGLPLVQAGRLNAIAISTSKRSESVPEIPSVTEFGYPNYSAVIWYGVLAPAGTPAPIVATLRGHLEAILATPAFRKQVSGLGAEIFDLGPEAFGAFMREDLAKWAAVIKAIQLSK